MLLNSLRIPDIAFFLCSRPSVTKFAQWLRTYAIEYCFYFDPLPKAPKTPEDADNSLKLMHILGFNKAKHAELARCYNAIAREAYGLTECLPALYMPMQACRTWSVPPEAVLDHCKGRLAPFKIPRYLEYGETLPMTDSARVQKQVVADGAADLRSRSYDRVDRVWR